MTNESVMPGNEMCEHNVTGITNAPEAVLYLFPRDKPHCQVAFLSNHCCVS